MGTFLRKRIYKQAAQSTALVQCVQRKAETSIVLPAPQPGPQTEYFNCEADIIVYGGAAGGGKTFGTLLKIAQHQNNPDFGCVVFRRESPQITNQGGLWDESEKLFSKIGATPYKTRLTWRFPGGGKVKFAHLQYEHTKNKWQGAQVPIIAFDELPHFTETQFFYLISRNRSVGSIKKQVLATCNPQPGWVKSLLSPWLDRSFPNPARSGEIRYFIRKQGIIEWVDADYRHDQSEAEKELAASGDLNDAALDEMGKPKSITFIRSSVYDNKILLQNNPEYIVNLKSQPLVEQERLLHGNWDVFEGAFFDEWSDSAHTLVPPYTPEDIPKWWHFFGGLDWGYSVKSPFAFVLCAIDENGTIHVIDEIKKSKLTNESQADHVCGLLAKWGVPRDILIAADPSMWNKKGKSEGPGIADIEAFWSAGLGNAIEANNSRQSGWSQVRKFLHTENAFKVWKGNCPELIRTFPIQIYDDLNPNDMDTTGDDHLLDGLRYALQTRPQPGVNTETPKDDHRPWFMKESEYYA